jgi:predicted dehydrogenase
MSELDCNVAIIGAGNMAREHIRAFKDVPGVNLVGIHSRTRSKAKALADEFQIDAVYDSITELYTKTRADLVVITVFELAMNSVSRICFEYPWTALLEKPPGYTVKDAEEIRLNAKKKKRTAIVALNRRFMSSTLKVQEDLKSQADIRYIRVQDQEDQKQAREAGQPSVVVDNWMYANSIHTIDYFQIFGRANVSCVKPVVPWNPDKPGVVIAHLEYENGDLGLYEGIWDGPSPWSVSVSTPQNRWEVRPLEQASFQKRNSRVLEMLSVHPWDTTFKPGFRLQAEHAVLTALGEISKSPTLDDTMITMKIIEAIFTQGKKKISLS